MNIILIGTNGAGKTTIATKLYKDGYHVFKEAPRGKHHFAAATLCLTDHHIVFDRWNVIDRAIYEQEENHLHLVLNCAEEVNRNNVIIYMRNDVVPYDAGYDDSRSVQRPPSKERIELDKQYYFYTQMLIAAGIDVKTVYVHPDVEATYTQIKQLIGGE